MNTCRYYELKNLSVGHVLEDGCSKLIRTHSPSATAWPACISYTRKPTYSEHGLLVCLAALLLVRHLKGFHHLVDIYSAKNACVVVTEQYYTALQNQCGPLPG